MHVSSDILPSIPLIRRSPVCQVDFLISYISSAIVHGISHAVGHVAVGTMADLVLWKPENFGVKPEMVLKSGVIALAQVDGTCYSLRFIAELSASDG